MGRSGAKHRVGGRVQPAVTQCTDWATRPVNPSPGEKSCRLNGGRGSASLSGGEEEEVGREDSELRNLGDLMGGLNTNWAKGLRTRKKLRVEGRKKRIVARGTSTLGATKELRRTCP